MFRKIILPCVAAGFILALVGSRGAWGSTGNELKRLADERAQIAFDFSVPIAACVQRNDTENPVFHGCMDWHTAVMGIWALVAYGHLTGDDRYQSVVDSILRPDLLQQNRQYLIDNPNFEMPFGRSWFLRLAVDYHRAFPADPRLDAVAEEAARSLVAYYTAHAPNPATQGYHNANWALISLYDYGQATGKKNIMDFVRTMVRDHYQTGKTCDAGPEVSSGEFSTICASRALLMSRVMPQKEFVHWVETFMPDNRFYMPVTKTISVHQIEFDFARAWALWGIYRKSGNERFLISYIDHLETGFSHKEFWQGPYETIGHAGSPSGMLAVLASYENWPGPKNSKPEAVKPFQPTSETLGKAVEDVDHFDYYSTYAELNKHGCHGITFLLAQKDGRVFGTATAGNASTVSSFSGTIDRTGAFEFTLIPSTAGAPNGIVHGSEDSNKLSITMDISKSGCTDGAISFQAGDAQ